MKKKEYQQPEVKVVEIACNSLLTGSNPDVTVNNPWSGNTEEEW